jgi:DNA-binding transcriptional regulator YhcF (GntR family)
MTTSAAPYLRIVDEIAARIASGALRPGDRVPSTRQITKEWGVAIATASKVIAELRRRGLVEAVAGVGTVVSRGEHPPAIRSRQRRLAHLNRELPDRAMRNEIARAAIAIADTEGLAAVSMRRIAVELGMPTMSLYRWFPGKDDLTLQMMDLAFDVGPWPDPPPPGWRAQLDYAARRQWAVGKAHPWVGRLISLTRPQLAPNGMYYTEWAMRCMCEVGLSLSESLTVSVALAGFVQGIAVNLETEVQARQDSGLTNDEFMDRQADRATEIVMAGDFPTLRRIFDHADVDFSLDEVFETGLRFFLDGVGLMVAARATNAGSRVNGRPRS